MRHEIDGFLVLPGDVPASMPHWIGAICRSGSGGAGKVSYGTNCGIVGITQRDVQICLHRYKMEGEQSGFHRTDVL